MTSVEPFVYGVSQWITEYLAKKSR
jgi:hypothetical protein